MVIQILISIFSLFVLFRLFQKFKEKSLSRIKFSLWFFFWIFVIFLVWQPNLTNYLAAFLQVGRGVDAVIYLSLILIFYLLLKIFVKIEDLNQQITILSRKFTLKEEEKEER